MGTSSKKSETKSENSSKSSGIGEDMYESSNNESPVPSSSSSSSIDYTKKPVIGNNKENLIANSKRNSSDSAFVDVTIPVSSSLGTIAGLNQSKNKNQISNPVFLHSSMSLLNSNGASNDKSPSINSVNSSLRTVRKNILKKCDC